MDAVRPCPRVQQSSFASGYPDDRQRHSFLNRLALTCSQGMTSEGFCSCRSMRVVQLRSLRVRQRQCVGFQTFPHDIQQFGFLGGGESLYLLSQVAHYVQPWRRFDALARVLFFRVRTYALRKLVVPSIPRFTPEFPRVPPGSVPAIPELVSARVGTEQPERDGVRSFDIGTWTPNQR